VVVPRLHLNIDLSDQPEENGEFPHPEQHLMIQRLYEETDEPLRISMTGVRE
jgi:hypothetical protein